MVTNNLLFLIHDYSEMTTTEAQEQYIESIEGFIADCRKAANRGEEMVSDSVYDTAVSLLQKLKPDSPLLSETWSDDTNGVPLDESIDIQVMHHPMMSIQTIKDLSLKEMKDYANRLYTEIEKSGNITMHASMKMNGHGIRFVYNNGDFVKAHTRARHSAGRDITRAVQMLVPNHVENFEGLGIVEVRGELLLPFENLDKARAFKPEIKSAFTGVSAMIRESASDEEIKLLRIVAYAVYSDNIELDTLSNVYQFLEDSGFEVPYYATYVADDTTDIIDLASQIVDQFEVAEEDYAYFTDGVVLSVDDLTLLNNMGSEKSYKLGNVALKVGHWKQDMYSSVIQEIVWKEGRSKMTPVAVVEPTLTANGASVTNVPLYAPIHILRLEAYPGNILFFRFGGEAGVVPCFPDGQLITD